MCSAVLAFGQSSSAWAHDPKKIVPPPPPASEAIRLPEVVVQGRDESLIGVADSATQGTVGAAEIKTRPISRTGEILETVPGVIITQHAGGGKSNQYFLRGFNLDHGTDFSTSVDGVPINLPSHGHGQGYTDLNPVIPELVQRVNFQKGVYYAQNGDFSSAGAAQLQTYQVLPQSLALVSGGMYGFGRAVFAASPKVGAGHLLFGAELSHYDGPWVRPNDFQKANAILTYSQGSSQNGWSVGAKAYRGVWQSSDQVAQSAVTRKIIDRFGSLDTTTGGNSQRYSLQGEWHRANGRSATQLSAYALYYDLDLYSNFTYFATDPVRGDQFEQVDRRAVAGGHVKHTLFQSWWGKDAELSFGVQLRNDVIGNALYQTQARQRVDKTNAADGSLLPARTRSDTIVQSSLSTYVENKIAWTPWFRTVAGVRGDLYNFNVDSVREANSGNKVAAIASPKLSLIAGPWAGTEIYAQAGMGFHSNDARGVLTKIDPISGANIDGEGQPIRGAHPLVRTYGAEGGLRSVVLPGLQSTLAVWWLDIASELVFIGDAGTTEASRPSRRYGVEWANFYSPTDGLTFDFDLAVSQARFRDKDPAGQHIPGAIESVIAAGASYRAKFGLFSSVRLRYFGPRPLIEDNSMRSKTAIQLSGQLGYEINKTWSAMVEGFNLLNRRDHDIDYAYESRIAAGEPLKYERHFHPMEPVQVRAGVQARF